MCGLVLCHPLADTPSRLGVCPARSRALTRRYSSIPKGNEGALPAEVLIPSSWSQLSWRSPLQAVVVTEHGGPEVLTWKTIPDPIVDAGEVLVRNLAIGVNFVDVQHRRGSPYPVELPLVPGTEAAGVIEKVGPGVDPRLVGRMVVHFGHLDGVYAELTSVSTHSVAVIPETVSAEVAAAVAIAGTTAHVLTRIAADVRPGQTVLVHAAAGSTGAAIVQLATAAGATVIAAASDEERARAAMALGAKHALAADALLPLRVQELTSGRGVDYVFDANGGPTFDASLAALALRGTLVLFGQSGGPVALFDPARLSGLTQPGGAGSLTLRWVAASHYLDSTSARSAAFAAVMDDVTAGRLLPRIHHRIPLSEAADAHRLLESRGAGGKIILLP